MGVFDPDDQAEFLQIIRALDKEYHNFMKLKRDAEEKAREVKSKRKR